MKTALSLCVLFALTPGAAQQGATTLAALTTRADAIVRVRVLAVDSDPIETIATVRVLEHVAGAVTPRTLVFEEPGGRQCGRALHGLMAGVTRLAFLRVHADGRFVLLGGGARCLPIVEPGLVEHIAALSIDRLGALVAGLDSSSPRVRTDSGHALFALPDLPRATSAQRERIARAVRVSVDAPDTRSIALLDAAARLNLRTLAPELADRYLAGPHVLDRYLRETIVRLDPEAIGSLVAGHFATPHDDVGRQRALDLLEALPPSSAVNGLRIVLRAGSRTERRRAGVAWLGMGLDAADLRDLVSADDYEACTGRVDQRPRFRSLRTMETHR